MGRKKLGVARVSAEAASRVLLSPPALQQSALTIPAVRPRSYSQRVWWIPMRWCKCNYEE